MDVPLYYKENQIVTTIYDRTFGEGVYFKNGNLILVGKTGEPNVVNEMSIKPNTSVVNTTTRYWGRVNSFNYSLLASTVKSVIIIRKENDKVWVDNRVTAPVQFCYPPVAFDPENIKTVSLPKLVGYGYAGQDNVTINVSLISNVDRVIFQPYIPKPVKGSSSSSSSSPPMPIEASTIDVLCQGKWIIALPYEETLRRLAAAGWGTGGISNLSIPNFQQEMRRM